MSNITNLIHALFLVVTLALIANPVFAMGGGSTTSAPPAAPAVPEPTAAVLFALGLGVLMVARRLQHRS
jgi:hypothetical protein